LSCRLNWEGIARLLKVPQGFELVFPKKLKDSKDILAIHENGLLLHCPEGSKQAEIINLIQPKG